MPDKRHFEDFQPGHSYNLGSLTVSAEEIVAFATEFDPQPFHLEEDAGKASLLGGLSASGWHTCSLVMRLLAENLLNSSTCQGSPGISRLKWRAPVRPGDTLTAEALVLETRALRSKPDLGMVTAEVKAKNQAGTTVLLWENSILFAKRDVA